MFSAETQEAGRQWALAAYFSQYIVGFLGKEDGAGGWTFFVPGYPGKVYCRVWQAGSITIHEVTNFVAPLEPNLRVWMRYFNSELMVEFADPVAARNLYGTNVGAAGVPTYVGIQNNDLVVGLRFLPGRVGVTSPASMSVNVYDFDHSGGHWYGQVYTPSTNTYNQTNNFDLTAYKPPGSGYVGWVAVYLDPVSNSLAAAAGETIYGGDDTNALVRASAPTPYDIPIPSSAYPLGAVALASNTTAINASTLFVDLREHLASAVDGGALLDLILTDSAGDVLSDSQGNVIFT